MQDDRVAIMARHIAFCYKEVVRNAQRRLMRCKDSRRPRGDRVWSRLRSSGR